MASISSLSSSTSSIYGNRNILTGLASGMDTESMIENAVSGIKTKIQTLQQKRTKLEWQQEAYRSIIDKAVNFNTKYTSYTSKTNLLSNSFFTSAVNTAVNGTYADKVTASGKTSSDIKINAVKQLATAATYSVSGLNGLGSSQMGAITGGESFNITDATKVSTISGSLSFQYGGTNGTTFDISFDELEDITEMEGDSNAEKLANAIRKKLSEVTYNYTKNGFQESTTADKAINVTVENGLIKFSDGLGNGNKVTIGSATGDIKDTLGIQNGSGSIRVSYDTKPFVESHGTADYLAGKTLGFTFNGVTKNINMDDVLGHDGAKDSNEAFTQALNEELAKAFGSGKIEASYDTENKKLSFKAGTGDTMAMGGSALATLGFQTGDANYINTGRKLSELLGSDSSKIFSQSNRLAGVGEVTEKTNSDGKTYYVDEKGNRVDKNGYRVDNDGNAIYDFEINGAHINITKDTTLESLVNSINSNPDAGVKVSYSKLTNEFKFTATETGSNSSIKFGKMAQGLFGDPSQSKPTITSDTKLSDILGDSFTPGKFDVTVDGQTISLNRDADSNVGGTVYWLNEKLKEAGSDVKASFDYDKNTFVFKKGDEEVDATYGAGMAQSFVNAIQDRFTPGQDAVMDVEINGVRFENLTRSTNNFDLDGLSVTVKGKFDSVPKEDGAEYEPITFETTTDTEKIIEAIRSFVEDYNELATELKSAYSTTPSQKSDGSRYDPLTAEQEEQYTESELAAYNEKAKQGLLFADTTLTSFYSKLLNAIQPGGSDGQTLREIGIGTSYSNGMTTLSLDEDKLRTALETDPDKVKNAFTKSTETGSSSNGLMQTLQNSLNTYVKTTGEPKGALIVKAGSVKAPTSLNSNSLLSQMNSIDTQIERWQDKMSTQIDRYTTQFSRLEQLIAQMNSQASAFSGLMGGSTGY